MPVTGSLDVSGAIVAGLFLVGAVLFYVGFRRSSEMRHAERMRMIEKGIAPPPPPIQGWPGVKQQEQQLRFEERRLLIEKGLPLPPERVTWQAEDYLRTGIITLCLGIGAGIAFILFDGIRISDAPLVRAWLAVLGPVLALHGVGCLAIYAIAGKRAPDGQPR